MSSKKFVHNKISVELHDLLLTHIVFKNNWKAIDPTRRFLEYVAEQMNKNEGKMVQIYSQNIKGIYQPYTGGEYRLYLSALKDLRLLEIKDTYMPAEDSDDGVGKCKEYLVTNLTLDLIYDINQQYLHLLHTDKKMKRLTQKSISNRKIMKKTYNDYLMNYMNDLQKHLNYKYEDSKAVLETLGDPISSRGFLAVRELIKIEEKDYSDLKYCAENGRLISDYTNMIKDVRNILKYKSYDRVCVVDIRACHPTYFSAYLYYNLLPTLPTLHNVGYNRDNPYSKRTRKEIEEEVKKEHIKWISVWTNPKNDIREEIGKRYGKNKQQVKDAMNKTLNGNEYYDYINDWLKEEFPALHYIFNNLCEKREVGVRITQLYEVPLMTDTTLYEYIDEMGLKIGYENDGFSVFAEKSNENIKSQINFIVDYIKFRSKQKWNITPVLKSEYV